MTPEEMKHELEGFERSEEFMRGFEKLSSGGKDLVVFTMLIESIADHSSLFSEQQRRFMISKVIAAFRDISFMDLLGRIKDFSEEDKAAPLKLILLIMLRFFAERASKGREDIIHLVDMLPDWKPDSPKHEPEVLSRNKGDPR